MGGAFSSRLYLDADGRLLVMNQNHLWEWNRDGGWDEFGPEELQGRLFSVVDCCMGGPLLSTAGLGVWKEDSAGTWLRMDGGYFDRLEPVDGVAAANAIVLGTRNGVFVRTPAGKWSIASGLESTVTDIAVLKGDDETWLASTPASVFRTMNHGMKWESVSPPWIVWSLAITQDQRVFAARSNGVAWIEAPLDQFVRWKQTQGLEGVTIFRVRPEIGADAQVWAGTWGNDIGISLDGGATMQSLHNGLETLSVLDIWAHDVDGQFTVGTIEGLYRSDDGGKSWFKLPGALQQQTVYSVYQSPDGRLMAGASNGLWQSDDWGTTWTRSVGMPEATVLEIGSFSLDSNDKRLWAATEQRGLWISNDRGETWEDAGLDGITVFSVAFTDTGSAVAATSAGLFAADLNEPVHRRNPGISFRGISN